MWIGSRVTSPARGTSRRLREELLARGHNPRVGARIPRRFGLDPIRDVQVLCPMNRGGAGARALITALQAALNPERDDQRSLERFGFTYRVGDKVMQISNNYDRRTLNGDIGFISAIDHAEGEVAIDIDGRRVVYAFGELDEIVLAYATTIDKSQGSEYPAVVIPLVTQLALHRPDARQAPRRVGW